MRNESVIVIFDGIDRKQDEEHMRKRKILIERLRKPIKNQTARIVRSQIRKMHSDSTLLNPTKTWSEKCKMQDLETKKSKKLQYIKDLPHLYVLLAIYIFIYALI